MRLVFVGELNPYGSDPRFALYHLPRHASGNRLREHLGLYDHTYEAIPKRNLCSGRWNMREAREAALALRTEFDVLVCLGSKVKTAITGPKFSFDPPDFFGVYHHLSCKYVALPHPSGLNRVWNQPNARELTRNLLCLVAPDVPWGETEGWIQR